VRLIAAIGLGLALLGAVAPANAAGCPGNPSAMGTSRVLTIDPREYPRIGTVQYQDTLPLEEKEVVLTFDDGPLPPYTNRVLETLAQECVKANFFIVGRMARGYPELLRRIHAEGHVIGTHSENHPLAFEKMPLRAVQTEIDQGFASTRSALRNPDAVAPFFRIPGLLRADTVEQYLHSRNMVTWSADVVADDWKHITASEVVSRSIARLDAKGKGILLLHDIQPATALALPHLLRELKRRGYKIVQVAPSGAPAPLVASAPRQPAVDVAVALAATPPPPPAIEAAPAPQIPQRQRATWPVPFPATTPPAVRLEPAAPAARIESEFKPEPQIVRIAPAVRNGHTRTPSAAIHDVAPSAAAPAQPAMERIPEPPASEPSPPQPQPEIASAAHPDIPPEAAVAQASPEPAASPEAEQESLPRRAMPVPILEAVRPAPANSSPSSEQPESTAQLARPLMPGFKPSHSDRMPKKVTEFPVERQQADPWAMRADLRRNPR